MTPSIIFEDNHLLVVIKPQGIPTQPDASGDADMLSILKSHRQASEEKPGEAFVGMIHRLDRVTGGVMVFAKTSKAASRLSAQLKDNQFTKRYLAIVTSTPKKNSETLIHYLLKNEKDNKVDIVGMAVAGAKRAELTYTINETRNNQALLEVDLLTGRSHQIRVQLNAIGCPIVGDRKYGRPQTAPTVPLALWAHQLSFIHPTTGDNMKFIVNPPEDGAWINFDFQRKSHKTR
ncbi:MAG: RluA family pseudouridine synthase [Firmicutes bacterium]|nr:RluA family pseudouridine synthase [Bacillota bacterium]